MKKSKKLLSVLAAVLLMGTMMFMTVFAAGYPDVTATIHLTTRQSVARAGQTRDSDKKEGYYWGKNEDYSSYEVYLIPRVRKDATISVWHDLDKVTMNIGKGADGFTKHKFSDNPHVYWSVELNPVGAVKSGCDAKARIGVRPLTATEKK